MQIVRPPVARLSPLRLAPSRVLALHAVLVATASCGGDTERGGEEPGDTATWTVAAASAPARLEPGPLPVLSGLRTEAREDLVRVTFEIGVDASGVPGYRAEYVDRPLVACGSGEQIFPVGDAWLEVRLEPAAAHTEEGQATLGPREVAVDGPLLLRVYRTCDFEGIVTHVLALARPGPYRVLTLTDPRRIVVEVQP